MLRKSRFLLALVVAGCAGHATGGIPSPQGAYPPRDLTARHPLTRAEASGFTETSSYTDVMTFIEGLRVSSKDIYVASLGKSPQGKDLPLVIMSRPLVRTAAEAKRLGRPIVLVQANIHGGEVEGKEALLALMRDLELDPYKNVIDSLVILAVPIYNADGNDSLGAQRDNRGSQNGPERIGRRANGQNFDLNRDYIKAEAPETKASLKLFNEWEPDVFVDLHTTDGSYHGYALTWSPPLNPASIFSGPFTRDTLLPALAETLRHNRRLETFPYGNFVREDSLSRGWITYEHKPRYGTNYYGMRGRISILSEAYSHDPFRKRIASTYAFVNDLLSLLAANPQEVMDVGRDADRLTTGFASTGSSTRLIPIRSRFTLSPSFGDVLVEELIRTPGDTTRYEPGVRAGTKRTGKTRMVRMPVIDRFESALDQTLPYAWVIPAAQAKLIEPLKMHGIVIEQLVERTTLNVRRFSIDSVARRGQPFQGHQEVSLEGRWSGGDTLTLDAGTYIIRAAQPRGILALALLEPQSDDGLVTWNFLDEWIQKGGTYPVFRVHDRITAPLRGIRSN